MPARSLSFGALCGVLCAWVVALRVLLIPIAPHDFWWHMAQGRAIAAMGRVPTLDAFSYTRPAAPFFDQSWLAQWIFHALHSLGGIQLLIFVQCILVVASYFALWAMARARAAQESDLESGAKIAALVILGVIVVSFDNWLLRPQTLAIPLFVAWLWTLESWRRNRIASVALIAAQVSLLILWVNIHGSFPLAILLNAATVAGTWLEASRGRVGARGVQVLVAASVASLLAILVNPRGLQVLGYVQMMLFDASNRFSAEWLSPTPRNFGDAMFFLLAIVTFLALAHAPRRPLLGDTMRLAVFFWLAITSGRYILWFALVAALPLARALAPSTSSASKPVPSASSSTSGRLNALVAGVMWLGIVPLLPWFKPALDLPAPLGSLVSEETPVRAAQVLGSIGARRLWHNPPVGSYLTWAAPRQKVWIDTRFELYPPQQWRDFLRAQGGDASVLDKYKCDAALIDSREEALLERALRRRGWKQLPVKGEPRFSIWRRASAPQVLGAGR